MGVEGSYHWTSATFESRVCNKVKNQVTGFRLGHRVQLGLGSARLGTLPGVCLAVKMAFSSSGIENKNKTFKTD